ncbi:hypothetical protein JOF37_000526 [Microbacterium imperiale]|nr:hypothetical protein [Microbacterium imperiale]
MEGDGVGKVDSELERLLDRDDAVLGRAGSDERAEHSRLARVRGPRDDDRASPRDGCAQHIRLALRQRPQGDEVIEGAVAAQELPDVHRPVPSDVGDRDVQAGTVREGCVGERLAQVDAAPRRVQHPFGQVAHLRLGQRQRDPLAASAPRHEDAVGGVDPQLLDARVIQQRLQRPVPRQGREDLPHHRRLVVHRRRAAREREVVVMTHLGRRHPLRRIRMLPRVDALSAQPVAHPIDEGERRRRRRDRGRRKRLREAHPQHPAQTLRRASGSFHKRGRWYPRGIVNDS